ncbi:nicotinate-nucleotide--dimethylbenzimidazole phosphoribosyltransferase [Streptomyces sp. NRRL S-237]|uniref:nicotinate-nucleotide--dimethylbenzimidazole phosphoribosyltransferase n=1 Tax=Streptomyces sp. NRRL S-237 TaxID=1463895 RepID=UPI0004C9BDD8|nr:nicotinate-nucleotide--dimethylbenzimidazole phosphoribosyltransferase [Streptomyces sp. NRRL S-237]
MTDTGQVPGEGLPDNAGMVDQQSVPAPVQIPAPIPDGYAFQDLMDNPAEPEDEELLLMPSGQGAWSDPQVVPQAPAFPAPQLGESQLYADQPYGAEPSYSEAPAAYTEFPPPVFPDGGYSAGAHETGGRDSGALDLGGLVVPPPAAPVAPAAPMRRPLHMGPPMPEANGGVVRSLADRGPAAAPAQAVPMAAVSTPAAPIPFPQAGPPTTGPEYLDIRAEAAPAAVAPSAEIPPQAGAPWTPEPVAAPEPVAEAVAEPAATPVEPEPTPAPAPAAAVVQPEPVVVEPEPQPEPQPEPVAVEPTATEPVAVEPAPEPEPEPVAPVEPPAAAVAEAVLPEPVVAPPVAVEPQPEPVAVAVEPTATEPAAVEPRPEPVLVAPPVMAEPVQRDAAPVEQPEAPAEPAAVEPQPEPALAAPAVVAEPAPAQTVQPQTVRPEPEHAAEHVSEQAPLQIHPEAVPEPEPEPVPAEQAEAQPEAEPLVDAPAEPSAGEAAPGYADAEREAVLRVMRERRDIRKGFRTDPIPHEVLLRVLEAAHTAPSVGHSQPWDFVVIRSAETRRTMHELAQRQREAYAKSLPKGRAKQFKELKIEAILDTPVNIVVTADPTRGGRHTLGRHTQPQMAPYSSALAVENLWLAARAEGLGVGWVSFFDEREMVRELGLPEHLEVVAYLCVGYVDEFPEEPELAQAGWSQRRPLSWVVHEETYGRRALPGEEPHDLLSETVASIRPLDAKALGEAWERQKRMTKPAGALGMLEIISAQLSGLSRVCPPPIPEPAAVAIFAGDHGVHAQGVTPWPQEVTTQMVANFLGGGAVCNAFANQVGAEVCVIDVGVAGDLPATPGLLPRKVRPGTADLSTGPAMTREEAVAAIEVGIETARDLVAAGNKALLTGEMGIANTTVSAALISVFTGVDPAEVTGRGTGINDETHARKVEVVRRALELHQPDPADPIGVLAAIGGLEHAAIVGLLLGGASLRTPVILDGVSAGAAALVARAIAPESLSACIAGHRSAEPGHVAALNKLGLRPLVDLDLRLGEGTGALLALPLVQSAARAMHEVATFDSAGVTEK